jgi:SAM-dependent methyltransferase
MVVERGSAGACLSVLESADDRSFDRIYPAGIRALSGRFWTPVAVARRAAGLFREAGVRRVLDVGAGVGKFALAAAVAAPELHFVGIEQRKWLVEIARRARSRMRIANVRFRVADVTLTAWGAYDAFYFFNPFAENVFGREHWIDGRVELGEARFVRDVMRVDRALRAAPNGTVVVTYHGITGKMPACYELSHSEQAGSDRLHLWVKRRDSDDGSFAIEPSDCSAAPPSADRRLFAVPDFGRTRDRKGDVLDVAARRR